MRKSLLTLTLTILAVAAAVLAVRRHQGASYRRHAVAVPQFEALDQGAGHGDGGEDDHDHRRRAAGPGAYGEGDAAESSVDVDEVGQRSFCESLWSDIHAEVEGACQERHLQAARARHLRLVVEHFRVEDGDREVRRMRGPAAEGWPRLACLRAPGGPLCPAPRRGAGLRGEGAPLPSLGYKPLESTCKDTAPR